MTMQDILLAMYRVSEWYFGKFDDIFYTLIAFIVVDYITNVIKAIVSRQITSQIGLKEISKKIVILLLVGIANITDLYLINAEGSALRTLVILFYIAYESGAIFNNIVDHFDLPVPPELKDFLTHIYDNKDSKDF